MYGPHLLLLTNFDLAPPSRGYSTDQSQFYRILLRDPLVGWVVQKNFSNKSCCPYMILVSKIFLVAIGCLKGAQEAPDLPLAVAPDRNWIWTSWGPSRGSKSTPHAFSSLGAPVGECNFLLPFSWCNLEPPYRTCTIFVCLRLALS